MTFTGFARLTLYLFTRYLLKFLSVRVMNADASLLWKLLPHRGFRSDTKSQTGVMLT